MKNFIVKTCRNLLKVLGVAAVGASVTACYGMPFEPAIMYGCPTVDIKVTGRVTDKENKPVQGIKVYVAQDSRADYGENIFSDKDGKYVVVTDTGSEKIDLYLYAKDIDGAENGEYLTDSLKINSSLKRVADGDGAWYQGAFEATGVDIQLKEKEAEKE